MTNKVTIEHGLNQLCETTPAYKDAADHIRERMFLSLDVPVNKDKLKAVLIDAYDLIRLKEYYTSRVYLERHAYAPELNKLHLTDGRSFKAPYKKTISGALEYLIINKVLS